MSAHRITIDASRETPHIGSMKISILGAGSIGCYLGGLLQAGGADVRFIGRARYQAQIAAQGLRLTHFARAPLHLPADMVDFITSPESLAEADIIALCTKSQDTATAALQIAAHASPDVAVVSFQNGIRNPETLRKALPQATIIPAIVPFNVTPTGPGAFHCGTAGDVVMADVAPAKTLATAFEAMGQGVHLSQNITGDQWAKMIVNLNNGLNALSGGTLRAGLMQREYRQALAACVSEALDVARAAGVEVGSFNGRAPGALVKTLRLPNWAYRIIMQMIVRIDAQARSSMLDDLEAGRPSEINYLQGEIVRQAENAGRTATKNAAILSAVKSAFQNEVSPKLSGSEILSLLR